MKKLFENEFKQSGLEESYLYILLLIVVKKFRIQVIQTWIHIQRHLKSLRHLQLAKAVC